MRIRTYAAFIITISVLVFSFPAVYAGDVEERLDNACDVLNQIMKTPDTGIPREILAKCRGIVVIPHVVKAGFVFGGKYGKGVLSARRGKAGEWSAPVFLTIAGGSWGFQIGAEAIDLVLVVMNEKGLQALLKDKIKLGGDIGVSAGPVGRRAEAGTDLYLKAEILSYSRSRGFFAGISLEGATITEDKDANRIYYGTELHTKQILHEKNIASLPEEAKRFVRILNEITAHYME